MNADSKSRRRALAAGLALATGAVLATPSGPAWAATFVPWTRGPTPPLAARTLAGNELRLSDFGGRIVLVNFWATWCAPCVAEMPSLERLRRRMSPAALEIVGVNFQENAARIEPFVQRLRLSFPIVRDHDGALRKAWQVNVFPSTFVVGPKGGVAFVVTGEIDWDDPTVESRLRSLR